jgi:hypothetical protein
MAMRTDRRARKDRGRPEGYNRATVDPRFADYVKNEEEAAPEVVLHRKQLELFREHMAQLREAAAKAQADLNSALDGERNMEAQLTMAKLIHLQKAVIRQAQGIVDGNKPPHKPKSKRSRR